MKSEYQTVNLTDLVDGRKERMVWEGGVLGSASLVAPQFGGSAVRFKPATLVTNLFLRKKVLKAKVSPEHITQNILKYFLDGGAVHIAT